MTTIIREDHLKRDIGYHLLKCQRYKNALKTFNESLKINPNDCYTLIGRAKTNNYLTDWKSAKKDIEKILSSEGKNFKFMQNFAHQTYLCGEFELALVQNYRGLLKRAKPPVFEYGTLCCKDVIEDCIAEKAGHPLRDYLHVIKRLQIKKKRDLESKNIRKWKLNVHPNNEKCIDGKKIFDRNKHEKEKNIYSETKEKGSNLFFENSKKESQNKITKYWPIQKRTTNINKYVGEKYLGPLCYDKNFLENVCNYPDIKSSSKEKPYKLHTSAKLGYNILLSTQELLRARKPLYSIRYQENQIPNSLKQKQLKELYKIQILTTNEANRIIKKLKKALDQFENFQTIVNLTNYAKKWIDSKPKKYLPKKEKYLNCIYEIIGLANLKLKILDENLTEDQQHQIILYILGLNTNTMRIQNIIKPYVNQIFDIKKKIKESELKIQKAKSPQELAWLYHDLANYYSITKKQDLARYYAKKSVQESEKFNNDIWIINSKFIIAKTHILQKNINEAKTVLQILIEQAGKFQLNQIRNFFKMALNLTDKKLFENKDGKSAIEKREKEILNLNTNLEMKENMQFLFKKMMAVPHFRRLSIVPGVKIGPIGEIKLYRNATIALNKEHFTFLKATTVSSKPGIEFLNFI